MLCFSPQLSFEEPTPFYRHRPELNRHSAVLQPSTFINHQPNQHRRHHSRTYTASNSPPSPPQNHVHVMRSRPASPEQASKGASLLRRLSRRISDSRRELSESFQARPAPIHRQVENDNQSRSARHSKSLSLSRTSTIMGENNLERRKTISHAVRERDNDQRYCEEWREREMVNAGFFDTRQRLRPDLSATDLPKPKTVHPSSLSTFAPRAPLVASGSSGVSRATTMPTSSSKKNSHL